VEMGVFKPARHSALARFVYEKGSAVWG